MTSHIARSTYAAATVAIAAALWLGTAGAATAGTIHDTGDSEVSVAVPSATPAPSNPNPSYPPVVPPPSGGGDSGGGAGGSGGGNSGGAGSGGTGSGGSGGGGNTAPPGAADPACVPEEPAVPSAPATGGGEASADKEVYAAGETVTATAAGFGAAEQVQLVLFSEPKLVGNFTADAAGSVTAQFPIAAETLAGSHTLQFTGWCGTTSTVGILVGATNSSADAGPQGVPVWLWWVGGGLGAALLVAGGWWVITAMRAPLVPEVVAP